VIKYLFFSVEENNGIWCGAQGFLVGTKMCGRPQHLAFFVFLCKLLRTFWVFLQMKDFKDKDVGDQRRDDQKREETKRLEDEVVVTQLKVGGTLNLKTSTNKEPSNSQSLTKDVTFNYELNISKGIPDIMVKSFCTNYLRENRLDPRREGTIRGALMVEKVRIILIIELKDQSVSLYF
jgi:hypothetical protein